VTGGKVWRPAAQVTRPQVGRHVGRNRILTNRKSAYKLSFFEVNIERPDGEKLINKTCDFFSMFWIRIGSVMSLIKGIDQ
jgi:hypothetical protein